MSGLIGTLIWLSVVSWGASPINEIHQAKAFHEQSKSYSEWEQSPFTPEALAKKFRAGTADPKYAQSLCEALKKLKPADLFYAHEFLDQAKGTCFVSQKERYARFLEGASQRLQSRYLSTMSLRTATQEIPLDAKEFPVVTDGQLPEKTLVLTFDDGPHPQRTQELLSLLSDHNLLVQFFLVGSNTLMNRETVKAMAAAGHEVGCHSFTHPDMRKLTFEAAKKEIENGFAAINTVLGRPGHFFRYPYGAKTTDLRRYLSQTDTVEFFWNIDTLDWKHKDPEFLLNYALAQVEAEGRGIVLFHDIQPQTLAIMPAFLAAIKELGYNLAVFRPSRPRNVTH